MSGGLTAGIRHTHTRKSLKANLKSSDHFNAAVTLKWTSIILCMWFLPANAKKKEISRIYACNPAVAPAGPELIFWNWDNRVIPNRRLPAA